MSHPSTVSNLFSASVCPSDEQLWGYVQQKLSKEQMRAVELHLADCELCNDVVEAYRIAGTPQLFAQDITEINTRIEKRISQPEPAIFSITRRNYFAIAASILVLVGVGFLFNYFVGESKKETVSVLEKPKENTEPLAPAESSNEVAPENKELSVAAHKSEKQELKNIPTEHSSKSNPIATTPPSIEPSLNSESIKSTDANLSSGKAVFVAPVTAVEETQTVAMDAVKDMEEDAKTRSETDEMAGTTFSGITAPAAAQVQSRALSKESAAKKSVYTINANTTNLLTDAKADFMSGNYAASKIKLQEVIKAEAKNEEALFFLGKTERMLKQYQASNAQLNLILKQAKSPYYAEAEWLKALNLKDANNKSDAIKLFSKIAKGKGKYAYPAAEMRDELGE